MPADRHFVTNAVIEGKARRHSPGILEEPGVVAVTDLIAGDWRGDGTGGIHRAQQEAGERVSGGVQRRRQRRLMAGEIVLAVAARPVVAERAQTADVPTHLDIVFAADPA